MKRENEYKKYIESHFIESKKSALEIARAILHSELNAGSGVYTKTLHIPKFFSFRDKEIFEQIVQITYSVFSTVIEAYRKDEKIRALFPFDPRLEELILLPAAYSTPIPICRIDIFYDEDTKDFYFCEFNTDGTSAMNENHRLNELLKMNNVVQQDPHTYEYMEVLHSWTQAFLKTCREIEGLPAHPTIAIVDFLEHAYLNELYVYQSEFTKQGCECEVLDIRDLEYDGTHLYSKHTKRTIDVIYRRAITADIMDQYEDVQPFIQAVRDLNVHLIGAFQTQIVHHKEISKVLVNPIMQKYFSKEQNDFLEKHLPKTYDLQPSILERVSSDKDHWILKPKDSFAAQGVWAGVDLNEQQWKRQLDHSCGKDYIVQQYIHPYQSENIDLVNSDSFDLYSNMTGLYVYNGQLAGVYSRLSDGGIISTQYNERAIATLFMKED